MRALLEGRELDPNADNPYLVRRYGHPVRAAVANAGRRERGNAKGERENDHRLPAGFVAGARPNSGAMHEA